MKNHQKGFVIPLVATITAVLVIGGGVYMYENRKAEVSVSPMEINENDQVTAQTQQFT